MSSREHPSSLLSLDHGLSLRSTVSTDDDHTTQLIGAHTHNPFNTPFDNRKIFLKNISRHEYESVLLSVVVVALSDEMLWCGDVKLGCCEDWATLGREREEEERSHCSDRERREMSA